MSSYISWQEKKVDSSNEAEVQAMYNQGFVFVRTAAGVMQQTRSLRVKLQNFSPSSENRRVLRKLEGLAVNPVSLPIPQAEYDWNIHKLGKQFYTQKFGAGVFSAGKIKSLLTADQSNFNTLLTYTLGGANVGYAIAYQQQSFLHYAYPFYDLLKFPTNLGMAMMLSAILFAQNSGKEYIYLGSVRVAADIYKLQFQGLEYFDSQNWNSNIASLKESLSSFGK